MDPAVSQDALADEFVNIPQQDGASSKPLSSSDRSPTLQKAQEDMTLGHALRGLDRGDRVALGGLEHVPPLKHNTSSKVRVPQGHSTYDVLTHCARHDSPFASTNR